MAKVRTRKRGKTFSYIFEAGKIDGKRKVVEKGGYPTKDDAYKAGIAAYYDFTHGNIGITSFKNQILPYLGEIKVQDLTPAMIDKWIRGLQRSGLSYNTISSVHAFISNALNYAVYPTQLISSNPAAYIKVPRNAPRNVVKRHIISRERFTELLAKYPFGTPYYIPLLLLYHTGMRLGEVLGLTWQDVDFAAKKITVRRQIRYLSKRGIFFTTLKTESSNRYILVDDFLLGELQR